MKIKKGNTISESNVTYTVLRDDKFLCIYKSCVLRDDGISRTTRYLGTNREYTFNQLEEYFNKIYHE